MKRKAISKKVLVLGIDGLDPYLTRKYVDEGKLPNISKFLQKGVARKDLVMLGVLPTITPPSWTTLSTGAYPETHGITDFFRQSHENLDEIFYNMDSRYCKAQQLWDVSASEGKKTLVFHWPGSAWPPTSDNPNLHVVDGTNPEQINASVAQVDWEKILYASTKIDSVLYRPKSASSPGAGCIINDLQLDDEDESEFAGHVTGDKGIKNIVLSYEDDCEAAIEKIAFDLVNSPIKEPSGWARAPEKSKEFTVVAYSGLVRRPGLILKNESGVYDSVALYRSKKDTEPYIIVSNNGAFSEVVIEKEILEEKTVLCARTYKLLSIASDGSEVKLWMSDALDTENDTLWHPKSLYKDVVEHIGHIPNLNHSGCESTIMEELKLPSWYRYTKWASDALNFLIENNDYDVIFSHHHNVDIVGHVTVPNLKKREKKNNDEKVWQQFQENLYADADRYVGAFLHLLDKGWSIMVVSDHALVTNQEEETALLADPTGVMVPVMEDLGYTAVKRDKNGNRLREIDWEYTKAINTRGNFIWVNLKGRNKTGIVDPEDKDALEKKIIDDLYSVRDKRTGKRIVSFALQNKAAAILGLSGPETGDIVFFIEDGFAKTHGDGLSTCTGYADTSLSPIFMAAGQGFKKGIYVDRVIREVDVAPTVALLAGVKMPAQCEGGPLYQFFDEDV